VLIPNLLTVIGNGKPGWYLWRNLPHMKLKQKKYRVFEHKNGVTTYKGIVKMDAHMKPPNSLLETYEEIVPFNWEARLALIFSGIAIGLEFWDKVLKN
jgi:hypothetical protein